MLGAFKYGLAWANHPLLGLSQCPYKNLTTAAGTPIAVSREGPRRVDFRRAPLSLFGQKPVGQVVGEFRLSGDIAKVGVIGRRNPVCFFLKSAGGAASFL